MTFLSTVLSCFHTWISDIFGETGSVDFPQLSNPPQTCVHYWKYFAGFKRRSLLDRVRRSRDAWRRLTSSECTGKISVPESSQTKRAANLRPRERWTFITLRFIRWALQKFRAAMHLWKLLNTINALQSPNCPKFELWRRTVLHKLGMGFLNLLHTSERGFLHRNV